MLRFVNICLVLGLVALAYGIYQVKYEARGLDADIASLGKKIDEDVPERIAKNPEVIKAYLGEKYVARSK